MDSTHDLLKERANTHGSFDRNSSASIRGMSLFREIATGANARLPSRHWYAIFQILGKLARIVSHPNGWMQKEHWEDIRGYALLAQYEDDIEFEESMRKRDND